MKSFNFIVIILVIFLKLEMFYLQQRCLMWNNIEVSNTNFNTNNEVLAKSG